MILKNSYVQRVLDTLLVLLVLYPCMVFYWRGIWDLWGVYINPKPYASNKWDILLISALAFIGYFLGPKVQKFAEGKTNVIYFLITRGCMCVYAAFYMGFWRSEWETLDWLIPGDWYYCVYNIAWAYTPLIVLRCSRSVILPPMRVALDTRPNVLTPNTRFKAKPYTENGILDCAFTHFVINGLVIASWRGMMRLNYAVIYPNDDWMADHFCLGLGYLLCAFLYMVDYPLALVSARCAKVGLWCKVVFEDFCFTLVFMAHCVLWRGAWNCTVRYTLSDPETGGWLCFILGCTGLIVFQNLSYPGAMGCAIDGETGEQDVFFQSKFIRHFLKSNVQFALEKSDAKADDSSDSSETKLKPIGTELTTADHSGSFVAKV